MADWSQQIFWEDVQVGDALPSISFPLTVHRLVLHASASQNFTAIHHNTEWARGQGAPEMYINNVFAQGMWERVVREYIGLAGVIRRIGPLRMGTFASVGETVVVDGTVVKKWQSPDENFVELVMQSKIERGVTASGAMLVTLPLASADVLQSQS